MKRLTAVFLAALALVAVGSTVAALTHVVWWGLPFVIAAALIVIRYVGLRELGLASAPTRREIIYGIAGFVGTYVALALAAPAIVRWLGAPQLGGFASLRGNPRLLAAWILVALSSGAFGEEIIFRGMLRVVLARVGGGRLVTVLGVIVSSLIFGAAHAYQGGGGVALTAIAGAVYAIVMLRARAGLWSSVITHGLYDVTAMILVFLGVGAG